MNRYCSKYLVCDDSRCTKPATAQLVELVNDDTDERIIGIYCTQHLEWELAEIEDQGNTIVSRADMNSA